MGAKVTTITPDSLPSVTRSGRVCSKIRSRAWSQSHDYREGRIALAVGRIVGFRGT